MKRFFYSIAAVLFIFTTAWIGGVKIEHGFGQALIFMACVIAAVAGYSYGETKEDSRHD